MPMTTMIGRCGMSPQILSDAVQKEIQLRVTGVDVPALPESALVQALSQGPKVAERRQVETLVEVEASHGHGVTGHHPAGVHHLALAIR